MVNCTLCLNTRHQEVSGKMIRCLCYRRNWIDSRLLDMDLNPVLIEEFWSLTHEFRIPANLDANKKTSFAFLDKLTDILVAGIRRPKKEVFINRDAYFTKAVVYAATKMLFKQKTFKFLDILDLSEEHFSKKDLLKAFYQPDLTILSLGHEATKKLTTQIVQRLYDRALLSNKFIIFAITIPQSEFRREYPQLGYLMDQVQFITFS